MIFNILLGRNCHFKFIKLARHVYSILNVFHIWVILSKSAEILSVISVDIWLNFII